MITLLDVSVCGETNYLIRAGKHDEKRNKKTKASTFLPWKYRWNFFSAYQYESEHLKDVRHLKRL